jgi:hypothetical protein
MDRPVPLPRNNDWKLGRTLTENALSQERKATLGGARSSSPFAPRKGCLRPFCGFATLREVLEDRQTNNLEQQDAKIAKKSKSGNNFRRSQYVFQRRPQPPSKALPAFILRDLCDVMFSCFFRLEQRSII